MIGNIESLLCDIQRTECYDPFSPSIPNNVATLAGNTKGSVIVLFTFRFMSLLRVRNATPMRTLSHHTGQGWVL